MFGFHSLAPAKLYAGSEKTTAPKSKSVMGDVQSSVSADGQAMNPHGSNSFAHSDQLPQSDALTKTLSDDEEQFHEARDSGVGSSVDSHEISHAEQEYEPMPTTHTPQPSWTAGTTTGSHKHQSLSPAAAHEPIPSSHTHQPAEGGFENSTASIDFFSSNRPQSAEAGPSQPRTGSSHSSLQHDAPLSSAVPRPDETHFNAIAYRRDPETVIAYLVPLPPPTVQGTPLASTEPKYFLYAPPPPHLLKPRHGASEGYVRKLNRHWQQNVRRAKRNAHNGKRISAHGVHSKLVRGATWGMDKLKYDDVTFLARIHPKTVTHLILIHPWGLAGVQTPEEVMRTFRAQMFESKKRAKRDSIISAVFFLPALAIDTAAIFFGGMAEVDGIWMLVSVTAYRTARFITRKMGPEPKTMELDQARLIEDAKRSGFPPPEPEVEEDNGPGAMRRSVDALRRSLGSVKYRMSMNQRRDRSKRRKGGESSSTDTSRPQTTEASQGDLASFTGGELEHHVEEETEGSGTAGVQAAAPPSTAHSGSELSGFLEHMDEEVPEDGQPGSSGGIFASDTDGHRTSAETSNSAKASKKGQNFQLTFYPSPAMEVLGRYVQESCHMKNGRMYPSPSPVPTEEDILAVVGWHPERREHDTPESRAEDEEWQTREIKDDLRLASRKAAKAWNKTCRKQAKQRRRGKKGGLLAFRRSAKTPNGKAKETSTSDEPQQTEKKARSAAIKARIDAVRSRAQRKQQTPDATEEAAIAASAETSTDESATQATRAKKDKRGRAAGAAAILCVPCLAIAERVKQREPKKNKEPQAPSEKGARRVALKQRLSSKRDALRQRQKSAAPGTADAGIQGPPAEPIGLETPTDVDGTPTDTERDSNVVASDVEDNAAQPKKQSAKGRLLAIPAAIAAAIGAALKKRRDGKEKKKTTTAPSEPKGKKPSRFSALQERFKARRTRVSKKEPATEKQSRLSKLKRWLAERKQKRQTKKADKTKARKAPKEDKPKDAKERVAVVGLIAGCFALPFAKAKQVRDKRRKTELTDVPDRAIGTPLSPVPEGTEELQQRAVASGSSTLAPSTAGADRPSTSYQQPVVEEEYEDPPEEVLVAKQYLPGHGQSEVPVRPGPPDARLGSSDTAVEQTASVSEPQQDKPQGAGGKFKAARTGMVAFASRRRATGEDSGETTKAQKKSEATEGESAPGGRFQGLKSGIEGLKAKRRTADSTQTDAAVENEKTKPAPDGDNAAAGGPFKSLKEGIANIRAKKTGTDPQSSEKVHKARTPGFIERMRWVWVVA